MSHDFERSLLLVIPSVLECIDGEIHYDRDFSNNLEAYLRAFETVTVACPAARSPSSFPGKRTVPEIPGGDRVRTIVLPEPYREDRYLRNRGAVARELGAEIDRARYILISPHAPFDWSTLAANLCIAKGRKYNMEGDWNLPQVAYYNVSQMPLGPNKLRKYLWMKFYFPNYFRALRKSSLALLQGDDVYNAYKHIAPNPHSVLNIQITANERIGAEALAAKIDNARAGTPLRLVYAGRAIDMKGPFQWLETLALLKRRGVAFHATWFGGGTRLDEMRAFAQANGLADHCTLPGNAPREAVFAELQRADMFLFCHMTRESPRCVVEALAAGTPIVGFGTDYTRGLVKRDGGGAFVEVGDVAGLAALVEGYAADRTRLAKLIADAGKTGSKLDRETAIAERIALMRQYL